MAVEVPLFEPGTSTNAMQIHQHPGGLAWINLAGSDRGPVTKQLIFLNLGWRGSLLLERWNLQWPGNHPQQACRPKPWKISWTPCHGYKGLPAAQTVAAPLFLSRRHSSWQRVTRSGTFNCPLVRIVAENQCWVRGLAIIANYSENCIDESVACQ